MNQLELKINQLRKYLLVSDFDIHEADNILYSIGELSNPTSIEFLIILLKDDSERDEFMFSIIHCIEQFPDSVYLIHLLNTIPQFIFNSPKWASIIHMRILNSEKCRIE